MNLLHTTFVALDLETTGLSPEKDTIIEVAAVKFRLERDGDIFHMVEVEERSMLIDPERSIDEHISMITGISDMMVKGKSKWHEVREKVNSFIGEDTIIIGHNVLFDIAMLDTHGIDLRHYIALDTFELSELFSPEAESLNLGFLGKHLGIDIESEHRALDDTRLSAQLFLHYLREVVNMPDSEKKLWRYARTRDTSRSIDTLLTLIEDEASEVHLDLGALSSFEDPIISLEKETKENHPYETIDLGDNWEEELEIIHTAAKNGKILLFTSSRKQSLWLEKKLSSYKVTHHIDSGDYISFSVLESFLIRALWTRKETILLLRLMKWVNSTETGRIDEIKWYGEEAAYKELLRSDYREYSRFREKNEEAKRNADMIIAESYQQDSRETVSRNHTTLIVRDIFDLDASLRYRESTTIHWKTLYQYVDIIYRENSEEKIMLDSALSMIEEIVKSVIVRPTGPLVAPPGEYGETYFYTQKDLWHHGYIWLIWAKEAVQKSLRGLAAQEKGIDAIEQKYITLFRKHIEKLSDLITYTDTNLGLILQIKNQETSLSIIPRQMKEEIGMFLSLHGGRKSLLTGYNISTPYLQRYLKEECGIEVDASLRKDRDAHEVSIGDLHSIDISGGRSVFLGTNPKHLRNLKENIVPISQGFSIYTQGISGGRGKMRTLFLSETNSILLGIIDTWKDDSFLWEEVDSLFILKVPFDPPTDPYYLARTTGMSNNFENYSLPTTINTLSTLIGRACSANPKIQIQILDEKLLKMNWGEVVRGALKI